MKRIAVIVGHSAKASGAVNFRGVPEYDFNHGIASNVCLDLVSKYECEAQIFLRKTSILEVGKAVKLFDPHFSIELHFNAAGYPVTGPQTEILCLNSKSGVQLAQKMAAAFDVEYKYGLRRDKGAKILSPEDRGFMNLHSTGKADALLIEPVFGDYETKQSVEFFSKPERYVRFMSEFIAKELTLPLLFKPEMKEMKQTEMFEKDDLIAAIEKLTAALERYKS
jgi:hypothetical protein